VANSDCVPGFSGRIPTASRVSTFGRELRPLWHLEPGAIFLNHGSFGACPKSVLAHQDRLRLEMEAQPDLFMRARIMPTRDSLPLREAIAQLARLVGAAPTQLALVENATAAVQAVVRSLPFSAGDEILITDHTYNAVRLIVEARCAETGARPRVVTLPLPADADAVVQRFRDAMTPQVRLAIVDHITSPTALALPLERILPELKRWGARVLVDGAHAVGHLPLDLTALGAEWYVSNAHKWLFAPKGTAFLYASDEAAGLTRPLVVSHYIEKGFPRSFDWVGTRDYTSWLTLPAALDFHASLDPPRAADYRKRLIGHATRSLAGLGVQPIARDDLGCSMRSFRLTQRRAAEQADVEAFMRALWERDRIQAVAMKFGEALLLRVSAQVYVDEQDIDALAAAIARDGWPGR
jgi:isopenicillin-N epimerase